MNLPPILSATVLRQLAAPDETHAMRVMLLSNSGSTQYTLRGMGRRKGKYLLVKDGVTGRHILDIPASLWNQDIPKGKYGDNPSIAHDLLSKPQVLTPFVVYPVPWNGGQVATVKESLTVAPAITIATELVDAVETISLRLLETVNPFGFEAFATPEIKAKLVGECGPTVTAFLEAAGRGETVAFIKAMAPPPPTAAAKVETPAAKRMREKRARDKAAREAANLQPA